jgi:hypothetical protein
MVRRQKRRCRNCRSFFDVCTKVKKHEYCKKAACQRARKRKWQKRKVTDDQTYRRDQKEAQEIWLNNNPDYWKQYRENHPEYTEHNRVKQKERNRSGKVRSADKAFFGEIAKMDALSHKNQTLSGRYQLIPLSGKKIAKMDALIVKIDVIKEGYEVFDS